MSLFTGDVEIRPQLAQHHEIHSHLIMEVSPCHCPAGDPQSAQPEPVIHRWPGLQAVQGQASSATETTKAGRTICQESAKQASASCR